MEAQGDPLKGAPYPPNLPDPPLTFLPTATAQTALSICIAGLDAVRSIGKDWVAVARKVVFGFGRYVSQSAAIALVWLVVI